MWEKVKVAHEFHIGKRKVAHELKFVSVSGWLIILRISKFKYEVPIKIIKYVTFLEYVK